MGNNVVNRLIVKLFFATVLLLAGASAVAQTACPVGVTPGDPRCGPDPNSSTGGGRYSQPAPRTVYVPTGEWRNGYGAVAFDKQTGSVGFATKRATERDADEEAIASCERARGIDCVVVSRFDNVCTAIAGTIEGGRMAVDSDSNDVEKAGRKALKRCERAGGKPCEVAWSDCSKSEYFRY